ncbi:REP-associated tyrosine transposase [Pseudomonas jinjuensis]|uniref:Transposase IS200 like n=1 Tax=Pseudomonas jinjuensis TaxID=198616 RepID=A0A1H0BCH9_9PSED|nr:transposase [Pseudomonas jinjuensis]SDN43336.1 Transposase IS200 like [Pseudomonas jinjuensis]
MTHLPHPPGHAALRKGRVSLAGGIYLVTTTTLGRNPLFGDFATACAAARCFEDPSVLGTNHLLAWVLMPDHAHWLIQLGAGEPLGITVGRLKSASSRRVNQLLGKQGPLWANAFHDRALRRDEDLQAIARYIVANPLRAGLVRRVGAYPFWNAVWL